jgi:hypothetical protein
MVCRFAVVLLALATVITSTVSCPCVTKSCAMAVAKQMDCCNDDGDGIGAPDCCANAQLGQPAVSQPADRPARSALTVSFAVAPLPAVPALTAPLSPTADRIDPSAAPPGGTLIVQHTSLLL